MSRSSGLIAGASNVKITYDKQTIDYGYNILTTEGIFVCDIAGVYFFSFSAYARTDKCQVGLYKNNLREMTACASGVYVNVSNSIVLSLQVGDRVWLELHSNSIIHSNSASNKLNSFSGYLIHEL